MAEDLRNYKLQLQQVEAALLTDGENEELLKLKADLEEVIALTQDLIKTQDGDSKIPPIHSSSNDDNVTASLQAAEDDIATEKYFSQWTVGEKCLAKWRADGMFYEAVIEEVSEHNLKVKFNGYTTLEVVSLSDVKSLGAGVKRPLDESKYGKGYNREYLKKKKQKKQQRFKQIEEERESEKNKWLSFNTKAAKKPGVKTKSIFASPDNLTGRVGIGTCGISGKPMTDYTPGEKWKKGG